MLHKKTKQRNPLYSVTVFFLIVSFIGSSLTIPKAEAGEMVTPLMPSPGTMVNLSPAFTPALLQGIIIHPENALRFDFLVQRGEGNLDDTQKSIEYKKLVKYFLASLTIPDTDQWVNLSPYEKNRIVKDDFGKTEMGRDLLAQDYILKQITASLIYPEKMIGKKFWERIYDRAYKEYGVTNIPVNTFNKVWIVPDEAAVYESGNTVYVLRNHLKVMLEEDYLSLNKHTAIERDVATKSVHTIGSQIVREIILPELKKEVNEGKNFAGLRQIYSGMILAAWYKQALKESLLGKIYMNQAKVRWVDQDPRNNEVIYQQYLKAFKRGVFNYIKEDVDRYTQQTIPRKYFSGGAVGFKAVETGADVTQGFRNAAMLVLNHTTGIPVNVASHIDFADVGKNIDRAAVVLDAPSDAAMTAAEYKQGLREVVALMEEGNLQGAAEVLKKGMLAFYGGQLPIGELEGTQAVASAVEVFVKYRDQQVNDLKNRIEQFKPVTTEELEGPNLLEATRLALNVLLFHKDIEARQGGLKIALGQMKGMLDVKIVPASAVPAPAPGPVLPAAAVISVPEEINTREDLAKFFRERREVVDLTREEYAKIIKVSIETVRTYETGQGLPDRSRPEIIIKIATALMVDPTSLRNKINKLGNKIGRPRKHPISTSQTQAPAPVPLQPPAPAEVISVPEEINTREDLANFFRERREAIGLTSQEYAKMINVSTTSVRKYETPGQGLPDRDNPEKIIKIAIALRIDQNSLVGKINKLGHKAGRPPSSEEAKEAKKRQAQEAKEAKRQAEKDLKEITKEEIIEFIQGLQGDEDYQDTSDADFYDTLVRDLNRLVEVPERNIEEHLNRVANIDLSSEEGKARFHKLRIDISEALRLKDLETDNIDAEVLDAQANETSNKTLQDYVIQNIVQRLKVGRDSVLDRLEQLGLKDNEDFIKRYRTFVGPVIVAQGYLALPVLEQHYNSTRSPFSILLINRGWVNTKVLRDHREQIVKELERFVQDPKNTIYTKSRYPWLGRMTIGNRSLYVRLYSNGDKKVVVILGFGDPRLFNAYQDGSNDFRRGQFKLYLQKVRSIDRIEDFNSTGLTLSSFDSVVTTQVVSSSKARMSDLAMKTPDSFGGIDLNSAHLKLRIKRDGYGVPLPWSMQDMAQLAHIQGLESKILEIKPVESLPIFAELSRG